jgi:hypothetical protein
MKFTKSDDRFVSMARDGVGRPKLIRTLSRARTTLAIIGSLNVALAVAASLANRDMMISWVLGGFLLVSACVFDTQIKFLKLLMA